MRTQEPTSASLWVDLQEYSSRTFLRHFSFSCWTGRVLTLTRIPLIHSHLQTFTSSRQNLTVLSLSLSLSSSFYSTQSLSDLYIPCLSISVFILLLYLQSNGIPPAPSKRIFLGVTCECLWIELVLLLLVSQYELPVALSFLTWEKSQEESRAKFSFRQLLLFSPPLIYSFCTMKSTSIRFLS